MKTIKLSLIMIVLSSTVASAQYDFAVGVRSGGTSGITLKNITSPTFAVEGIIGFWNDGLSITGLYERHPNAFGATGLHWTVGMGAHLAFYEANFRGQGGLAWFDDDRQINDGTFGIGVDAILGLEYKLPIPVAISFELKPFLEVTTGDDIWASLDPGLGIKIAF